MNRLHLLSSFAPIQKLSVFFVLKITYTIHSTEDQINFLLPVFWCSLLICIANMFHIKPILMWHLYLTKSLTVPHPTLTSQPSLIKKS